MGTTLIVVCAQKGLFHINVYCIFLSRQSVEYSKGQIEISLIFHCPFWFLALCSHGQFMLLCVINRVVNISQRGCPLLLVLFLMLCKR